MRRCSIGTLFFIFFCISAAFSFPSIGRTGEVEALKAELQKLDAQLIDLAELNKRLLGERQRLLSDQENGREKAIIRHYESEVEHYDYESRLRQQTVRALWWQTISSYVVLILVVAVTSLGIYLSYCEVTKAIATGRNLPATEITAEVQKVQLTSAVTGVVILVISLCFLYIFVDRVFQLDPVSLSKGEGLAQGQLEQGDQVN